MWQGWDEGGNLAGVCGSSKYVSDMACLHACVTCVYISGCMFIGPLPIVWSGRQVSVTDIHSGGH